MSLPALDNLVRIGQLKAERRNDAEVGRMLAMARVQGDTTVDVEGPLPGKTLHLSSRIKSGDGLTENTTKNRKSHCFRKLLDHGVAGAGNDRVGMSSSGCKSLTAARCWQR